MELSVNEQYSESKKYSDDIMSKVTVVLDENQIEYDVKSDGSEIVVTDKNQSKDSLQDTIYANIDVPKMVCLLLLDMIEVNDSIYIRQKTK